MERNPYATFDEREPAPSDWLLCSLPVMALGALVGVCHGWTMGNFILSIWR